MVILQGLPKSAVRTKRAVGYFRVSTVAQSGEHNLTLGTQQEAVAAYCRRLGYDLVLTFQDIASGRRDDRRNYRAMLNYVLAGNAEVVVITFLDRFGRNATEILRSIWGLRDRHVAVESVNENLDEEMMLLLRSGMAGAESRRISQRVRLNMSKAVRTNHSQAGRAPFGYQAVRQSDPEHANRMRVIRWEQEPVEAAIVREMYRLRVEENLGFKAIGDRLDTAGHRARSGRPFAAETVKVILGNPALEGTLEYGRRSRHTEDPEIITVGDVFPPIVSKVEWAQLQQRNTIREGARSKTHSSEYLLSGIARCGYCGGPMVGRKGYARKGRQYANYWCSQATRSRALCAHTNGHAKDKLEKAILAAIAPYADYSIAKQLLAEDDLKAPTRAEAEVRAIDRKLDDAERQLKSQLGALSKGLIDDDQFKRLSLNEREERALLMERRGSLQAQLDQYKQKQASAEAVPGAIQDFLAQAPALTIPEQKAKLQIVLKAILVTRDQIDLQWR